MLATTLTAFQNSTAKVNANATDLIALPVLWSWEAKADELRRWSESLSTIVDGPLKSIIRWVVRNLSTTIQMPDSHPCNSNPRVKTVECTVENNRFTIAFEKDSVSAVQSEQSVLPSAIHEIGIPEPCTDISYLLIDDLEHLSEARVDRYFRVWCTSGAAMLVASSTIRTFDTSACLVEVSRRAHCPPNEQGRSDA